MMWLWCGVDGEGETELDSAAERADAAGGGAEGPEWTASVCNGVDFGASVDGESAGYYGHVVWG